MKKWVVTIFLIIVLVPAGIYVHVWLPKVVPWIRTNADLLKGISSVVQIVLWVIAGLAVVVRLWWPKRKPQPDGAEVKSVANPSPILPTNLMIVQQQSPSPSALHQLPSPPADFTGRASELAELLEAVKEQGVAITGMHGMGGVGKTALALKIADQLKERYPDGQIYLDLKGVEESPPTAKEAMAYVIRSFDLSTKVPEGEAEAGALYRSVLHNKRVLLLMDNARDEQQVRPLIPPDGSLLIVTSRQHFVLPGLFDKNLDVLPLKDAGDLLRRIAPRMKQEKKDTVEELAKLCGFLPLALETVAKVLRVRVDTHATDYAARLKDTRERLKLTAADASLELSYQLLPAELQKRFRLLAVFPDTFDAAAVAAVWEANSTAAQEALGELLVYSLVEFNEATNRYRLHDLVRLFAHSRLTAKERETAQRRHAGHYLNVLEAADDLYLKGGDSVLNGLALFDAEWGNIRAGHAWAATRAKNDVTAAEFCWQYTNHGAYSLALRQHPRERITWLEAALQAVERLKNRAGEGAVLGNLGIAYKNLGEYRRAIEYQEQRLKIAREIGDRRGQGNALGNLGSAYYHLSEHRRAIEHFDQQLQLVRETGDRLGEGNALNGLGVSYYSLGEHRRAIEYHEQALTIDREIGNRLGEGQALGNLGNAYYALGEYNLAKEHNDQQLKIACEIGHRLGEANALWNNSLTLDKLGDRAKATADAESALKILEEIESPVASRVRNRLAKWREEEKAKGQAAE